MLIGVRFGVDGFVMSLVCLTCILYASIDEGLLLAFLFC